MQQQPGRPWIWTVTAGSVVVGIVAGAAGGVGLTQSTTEDLPSWIESLSTLAAFVAAAIAVRYAHAAFRLESAREQRWEDGQISAQASKVAAWWGTVTEQSSRMIVSQTGFLVRNASDVPVTSLWLHLHINGAAEPQLSHHYGVLPPSTQPILFRPETEHWEIIEQAEDQAEDGVTSAALEVSISFTDSTGKAWCRNARGQLFDPAEGDPTRRTR